MEDYKGCGSCKHTDKEVDQYPCTECKNNFVCGTQAYADHNLLWEPPDRPVKKDDPVNHPPHYTQGGIECIQAMEAAFGKEAVAHFCICNAFKYCWRSEHKNGVQDIDKAIWYLNKYKELVAVE